jgi:outer membrane protein TolC
MNRLASACLLFTLLIWPVVATLSAQAEAPPSSAPRASAAEIKELHEKRVALLKQAEKVATAQYRVGTIDFNSVNAIERELLEARLDAADTPSRRIAVLEESKKSADELVKITNVFFVAARSSELDVDLGKALVLEIRIKLLRERRASGAEKK